MLKSCSSALSLQTLWDSFQDTLDLYTRLFWSQVLLLCSFNHKGGKKETGMSRDQELAEEQVDGRWSEVVLGVEGSRGSVEPGFTVSGSHGQFVNSGV